MHATDLGDPPEWVITEPGIYDGMPAETYHSDPVPGGSLSSSGARLLLPPSCPAKYLAARDRTPTAPMELGTAAHMQVLGIGPKIRVVDAEDWRTKAAREAAAQARAAGEIPLLPPAARKIEDMAAALRRHKTAALLLTEGSGRAEQSIFWPDGDFGIWRRARPDWLPHGAGGLVILPDYKTTGKSVHRSVVPKTITDFGYHAQGDWYCKAVQAARPGTETWFMLIMQETDPPYEVGVFRLDEESLAEGERMNRAAMEIYRDCAGSGVWPGHFPFGDYEMISVPAWALGRKWDQS